jgi:predicted RNA-binding protein YlqC (UPF0109 family)
MDVAMKTLIELMAKSLVDNPEEVVVAEVGGENTALFKLRVATGDIGKVFGKQGNTARAMRTIMRLARSSTSVSFLNYWIKLNNT